MPPFDTILQNPNAITVVMLLVAAVWAFVKEAIVPGATHRNALVAKDLQIGKLEKEIVELKAIVYRTLEITERTQIARARTEGGPA